MIREANDLRNLVYARDFLRQTLDANTRTLEDLAKQQRSGPVAEDAPSTACDPPLQRAPVLRQSAPVPSGS